MTINLRSAPLVQTALHDLRKQSKKLLERGIIPRIKVILVGNSPASLLYTSHKKKFCLQFGALCEIIELQDNITKNDLLLLLKEIGSDPSVNGLLVQLPLPPSLSHLNIGDFIPEDKDVDGFNKNNITKLFLGDTGSTSLLPCTPKGIISLLSFYKIPLPGKRVTIIGRSHIVGRPLAVLLLNHHATVTICHSKTHDLKSSTQNADIIVLAIGKAQFFNSSYLKADKKPYIIDVGINYNSKGHLCGDADYEELHGKIQGISPVPGGIGPLTILSLAQNLMSATLRQNQLS